MVVSVFLGLLRLLKYFRFHQRISILTSTLEVAFVELMHFGIMFFVSAAVVCNFLAAVQHFLALLVLGS